MNLRIERINILILILGMCAIVCQSVAQNTEIEGAIKVDVLATDNTSNNLVVRQSDGTLAQRDANTLGGSVPLTVSLTGDTLYQGTSAVSYTHLTLPTIDSV